MSNEKRSIPLIDLSPWTAPEKSSQSDRDAVVGQVATACREIGFFAVMNHGVDASVMDAAWAASQQFFDLATAVKLESKTVDTAAYPYGYECNERLSAGKSSDKKGADDDDDGDVDTDSAPLDLKETFAIGPSNPAAGMPPRQIPAQPAVLATALNDYYAAMEDLALQLLDIFAIALELPKDYFRVRCDKHLSALRILNYFAMDKAPSPTEEPLIRAGAHTDYGALTILRSGGPGLQVKKDVIGIGDEETQDFADVPHLDNSYIINLGDMMQRWTNGMN
jgi:isopenicillin N synthase-like dioxygenase